MKKYNDIKLLNQMAFPIMVNYAISVLFEVLDKAVVGNYSTIGFAAVGIGSKIIYLITGTLGVLSVAYNIIGAEKIGKDDLEGFKKLFQTMFTLCVIIGISFFILSIVGGHWFFNTFYNLSGELLDLVMSYFYPASITVLCNLLLFTFSVYFRNLKDTKITLYSNGLATIVNLFFDYVLVYGKYGFPELGVKGAAVGSIIGLFCGIGLYIFKYLKIEKALIKLKLDKYVAKTAITLYVPLVIQDFFESTLFSSIIIGIATKGGTYVIAAYSLLETFGEIILLPTFAYATVSTTLSIQYHSSSKKQQENKIIQTAISISVGIVILLGLITLEFPSTILGIISSDADLIDMASKIIPIVIVVQVINSVLQVMKSYLQGIGFEKSILIITILTSMVSIIWINLLMNQWSLNGLYIGICICYLIILIGNFFILRKSEFLYKLLKGN